MLDGKKGVAQKIVYGAFAKVEEKSGKPALEVFEEAMNNICLLYTSGMKVDVAPVPASEYPTKAKRPENSRMSKAKLTENGFVRLPSWQDALERYLKEIL